MSPQFGHAPFNILPDVSLRQQSFKNIVWKGRQIISLPEAPKYIGLQLREAVSAVFSVRKWNCQKSLNIKKVSLRIVIQDV
jgi:hypothetical protein